MNQKLGKFLFVMMLSCSLLLLFTTSGFSYKKTEPGQRVYELEKIEINQVETYITNYGQYGQNPVGTAGCLWPKGSANAYIYGAGIWIAGVLGTDSVVVNGYNTVGAGAEFMPGPMEHNQDHLNDPQSHPEDRLYVSTVAEDFAEWPYVDTLGEKIVLGDQDTWCLFNGHEASKQCIPDDVTLPLTVTRHTFAWTQALLENMLFFEYIIENTGTNTIADMYVGLGSDLDIGNADDDLVGLDRSRSLGYTSSMTQEAGWDALPPYYIGFRFLQGPVADDTVRVGQDPANPDTIILPGERIPLTAFKKFTRDVDAGNDHERYLVMAGYDFTVTPPVYNPFGDSLDSDPSDKRMAMSAGPFTLAPGEADTIVMAMMFSNGNTGGLPYLLQQGDAAKQLYDLDWVSPGPPSPPPTITALIPDNQRITICWDNTAEKTADKYYPAMQAAGDPLYKEFDVEGYMVYRKVGKTGEWGQIAEFDKKNGIKLLPDGTENGADEGIPYTYVDSIGVYNGFEYYYGISAFDYNTSGLLGDTVFISLEGGKSEQIVVPRSDFGNVINEATSNVSQSGGATQAVSSNATPKGGILVTGDTYDVEWQTVKEGSGELPVYSFNVYNQSDLTTTLLSDIDAFIETIDLFASATESVTVDTSISGDTTTITTVTKNDSLYAKHWTGDFVSPLFDGIEYSGSIDIYFVDSAHTFICTLTVVTYPDTTDTTTITTTTDTSFVKSVDILLPADSIKVTADSGATYTDNLLIAGIMKRWALRGGVTYEIRWKTINDDTVTATIYDVTNDIQVPFGETWGDNWSFGPISFSNPDVNSEYITSDNLSSRTYFYICGVKYYFNFIGSEAYPMNWETHPVSGDVWTLYCSGEVVPTEGNNFTVNSTPFTFGTVNLDRIKVVPNPYIIRNPWEVSSDYGILRFINLPNECTIRIYTLAGNLIKTIEHKVEATATSAIQGGSEKWDILTVNDQRPASGIYIYHISTPNDGETKTGKFALIR
ncbi:MAG: T9SS type A sorting domain-containing protein [Candidatus Cloacimonadota bacterium]|nr:MAG: T9SS type A sorting domain-containing protein [Candidatus Cloacimonadota bacterium]